MCTKERLVEEIVREVSKKWRRIIYLTPKSKQEDFMQTLPPGKYRVTVAGGGGEPETKEFTLTAASEFKACAGEQGQDAINDKGGKGGGGMGYQGSYENYCNEERCGYGETYSARLGECLSKLYVGVGGACVYGCYKGKDGSDSGTDVFSNDVNSGGGAGGGSYFKVGDIEMILKSGLGKDGTKEEYGKGAGPDGYVIIERWE